MPSLNALLFSDIPADTIFRYAPPSSITPFLTPSSNSNGLALAPNGDLIVCQHAGRVTRLFPDGGSVVIASTFDGGTFNSPNDAVVRSDGTIYFSDPSYGGTGTIPFRGVYRLDPATNLLTLVYSTTSGQPNGVALSPDERILYVADSQLSEVRRFDVAPDGATSNGSRFTLTSAGGPGGAGGDGITVDFNGNLYVSTSVGVKVYRPDAGYLGRIQVAQEPANCAFGDADHRTLYITARTALFRVRLNVPGPY
jgi:gluconolactonase